MATTRMGRGAADRPPSLWYEGNAIFQVDCRKAAICERVCSKADQKQRLQPSSEQTDGGYTSIPWQTAIALPATLGCFVIWAIVEALGWGYAPSRRLR